MLKLKRALAIDGWMTNDELTWLAKRARDAKVIVEIGSWFGRSSRALADNTDGIVFCIDTWAGPKGYYSQQLTAKLGGAEKIFRGFRVNMKPHIKEEHVFPLQMLSEDAVDALRDHQFFPRKGADLLFIDGDHSYSAVKRDIALYVDCVRSGGILCGHDINMKKVVRAVDEAFHGKYRLQDGSKGKADWRELPAVTESDQRIWWVRL